jgi:hypothetical protein
MIVVTDKYRLRSEQLANRIVRKNIRKFISELPLNNITPTTFEAVVRSNITEDKIKIMYRELYFTVGKPIFDTIDKKLKRVKFFNENLFNELMAIWLQQNAGLNIVSVHSTLIQTILDTITQGYEQNLSVADISRLLQQQGFYRAQSMRIARTETTTITNASTVMAGNNSDLVLDKVWISAQNIRTRRQPRDKFDHLHMNGVKVGQDEDFNVSGEMLSYPGDITNREVRTSAGNIIQCRCKVALVTRVDDDGFPIRKIK